jgi:hypothetical protein
MTKLIFGLLLTLNAHRIEAIRKEEAASRIKIIANAGIPISGGATSRL